jgi:hypothetical protein
MAADLAQQLELAITEWRDLLRRAHGGGRSSRSYIDLFNILSGCALT